MTSKYVSELVAVRGAEPKLPKTSKIVEHGAVTQGTRIDSDGGVAKKGYFSTGCVLCIYKHGDSDKRKMKR